ncbi:MAG: TauD/TfdA family dioxygenase [Candidatus Eremiobacteraeota bacterium]|nr:TauD/TfdA family dioxygenase [Candidatus Eremiobacteraeota bacterium]
MGAVLVEPILGTLAWSGRDLGPEASWTHRLAEHEVREIEAAISASGARAPVVELATREDFSFDRLAPKLAAVAEGLENGRGMFLLRGLPVERWTEDDAARALWGLGTALGRAIPQNARGDLIGHVRYEGLELSDPQARGYQTRAAQSLHVDRCDVVGLLCMRKARSGGISRVVSSARVHNEMLQRCPWHLGVLYAPFAIDMRGEEEPGEPPVYYRPVFSYYGGRLSCGANRTYIRSGQERVGRPLNAAQSEALDAFYAICEEHVLAMDLEPGDLQLLNSYVTLHDRTEYVDDSEPQRMRHMLRLWLQTPQRRPLASDFGTYDFAAKRVVGMRSLVSS